MNFEDVLAYFVFRQKCVCYLTKLSLAATERMWSVIDEGMCVEQW
jgi:hypothetical protein